MSERILTAAELMDLDGGDPGLEAAIDVRHASMSWAEVAQEADDVDDLADLGKLLPAVFVELVDGPRRHQGEPHSVISARLGHSLTMAGRG